MGKNRGITEATVALKPGGDRRAAKSVSIVRFHESSYKVTPVPPGSGTGEGWPMGGDGEL